MVKADIGAYLQIIFEKLLALHNIQVVTSYNQLSTVFILHLIQNSYTWNKALVEFIKSAPIYETLIICTISFSIGLICYQTIFFLQKSLIILNKETWLFISDKISTYLEFPDPNSFNENSFIGAELNNDTIPLILMPLP